MSSHEYPLIQIVDENDVPQRGGTMDEAQLRGLWHRIARVVVFDKSTDRYLLQKVAPNPYYDGSKWNTTASGHVDEGETYEEAAIRETKEEMGIDLGGEILWPIEQYRTEKIKENGRFYRRHNALFVVELNQPPELSTSEEVQQYTWVNKEALIGLDESLATSGLNYFIAKLRDGDGD